MSEYPGLVFPESKDEPIIFDTFEKSNFSKVIGSIRDLSLISLQVSVQISICENDAVIPEEYITSPPATVVTPEDKNFFFQSFGYPEPSHVLK